jgi:hypothetical protein
METCGHVRKDSGRSSVTSGPIHVPPHMTPPLSNETFGRQEIYGRRSKLSDSGSIDPNILLSIYPFCANDDSSIKNRSEPLVRCDLLSLPAGH